MVACPRPAVVAWSFSYDGFLPSPKVFFFFLSGMRTSEEQDLLLPWDVSLNSADKLSPRATLIEKFKCLLHTESIVLNMQYFNCAEFTLS